MLKSEDMEQDHHDDGASVSRITDDQNNPFQLQSNNANNSIQDDRILHIFVDLQKHWLSELQCSREKSLVEMTEKLHQEFLSDQQKIRTELLTEFKQELDDVRTSLEERYRERINEEVLQMETSHRREISAIKKKQWCWHCEQEAVYFCCWNTSYCSQKCQHDHWRTHRKYCRRRKGGKDEGASGAEVKKSSTSSNGATNGNAA